MRTFTNRQEAGRELAAMLDAFVGRSDVTVLALPRGGVPVAFEIADALRAPLDVFTVRSIVAPTYEDYAIGTVATGGVAAIDWSVVEALRIPSNTIDTLIEQGSRDLARIEQSYRGVREAPPITGRTVIVVDDGVAAGSTMPRAVAALRTLKPARVVVAVPVASREAYGTLRQLADACLCERTPVPFLGVAKSYDDFSQTTDEEVLGLLGRAEQVRRPTERTSFVT